MLSKLSIFIALPALILSQTCLEPSPNDEDICCTGPTLSDDNPPDECLDGSTELIFIDTGICNENFDCCKCTSITVNSARSFTCGGDQSCIGVPLYINGDDLGAVLTCGGDLSCYKCLINADNLVVIRCDGDDSCRETEMNINQNSGLSNPSAISFTCNGDGTCKDSIINAQNVGGLLCNGDHSCEGSELDFVCKSNGFDTGCNIVAGGDNGLFGAKANIIDATLLQCGGDRSCEDTRLNITCVPKGCGINCGGDMSCFKSILDFVNVNLIECVGDMACSEGTIIAECILPKGCPIRCSAESPCRMSAFDVTNSAGILCGGLGNACRGGTFNLVNNVGGSVHCLGVSACEHAILNGGLDASNNVLPIEQIIEVLCSGVNACYYANLFVECDQAIGCPVSCSGNNACSNDPNIGGMVTIYNLKTLICSGNIIDTPSCSGIFDLIPIDSSFCVKCAAASACELGLFMVTFEPDIDTFKGITCAAEKACFNTKFNLVSLTTNPFNIQSIICGGLNSCESSEFNYQGNSDLNIDLVSCSGIESCTNASFDLNAPSVSIYIPCTGFNSCVGATININVANPANVVVTTTCNIVNLLDPCANAFVIINAGTPIPLINFS